MSEGLERRERWRVARLYVVPAIALLALTVPFLHRGDWQRTDTGRYAALGLQAWRDGSLWTLHTEPADFYFNKPPLPIWIHGLSLYLFGVDVWSVRGPGLIAAVCCLCATIAVARRLADDEAALWTGLVLALSHDFFRRTRSISPDLWQLLFIMLLLLAVTIALDRQRAGGPWRRWMVAAGVPLGLALMCKPLVALLVPGVLAMWLAWIGRAKLIPWLAASAGVAVAVALPWHASMILLHGDDFLRTYFGLQILDRASGALTTAPFDAKAWWYYVAHIVLRHWPWLAFVLLGLLRWRRAGGLTPSGEAERWAAVWTLAWLAMLTVFADRRDRYAIVLMPSLAVLAGLWVSGQALPLWFRTRAVDVAAIVMILFIPIGLVVPISESSEEPGHWRALYAWIEAQTVEAGAPPELWQGGFALERRARIYLRYGRWPRTTRNERGEFVVDRTTQPPAGAILLYHERDGLAPGPNETTVFESQELRATRLAEGGWTPIPTPDPGERR